MLLWNLWLTDKLPSAYQPDIFEKDIPTYIVYGEHISRIGFMIVAYFMAIGIHKPLQKAGLVLYVFGLLAYFASWLPLIWVPHSAWSLSYLGFSAPAYTPLLWLAGICCIGENRSLIFPKLSGLRVIFGLFTLLFLGVHNAHTWLVYHGMSRVA